MTASRMAGRIVLGAAIGLGCAVAWLVLATVVLEAARARFGFEYDDVRAAMVAELILVCAPILGGWLAWVRARRRPRLLAVAGCHCLGCEAVRRGYRGRF